MKTENYERTNICRWVLLLLNLLFAFGTVFPVFEYDADDKANMWNICRKMRIYSSADLFDRSPFPSKEYFWQSVLLTALVILLLIIPILHVMKLLGLLGESRRNSRGLSLTFSVCVTIGIIVVPFLYYFVAAGGRSPLSERLFFVRFCLASWLSSWSYIWLGLSVVAIILSALLGPTEPIFKGLSGKGNRIIVCGKCGRRNPSDATFCMGCGVSLAAKEDDSNMKE